jgi:glycosyltransferase involved in cell wall biosynthesis
MKISFVIPAHNEAGCIAACLHSILREIRRSGSEAEIVVVNNASTDGTARVAAGFRGVRVVDEPQKGLTFARQRGYLQSSGDIVAGVDADTRLTRGWIRTVEREFTARSRLVCLSGPYIYHDLSPLARIAVAFWYLVAFVIYGLVNQYVLRVGAMLQGGNHAARRTALQRIGGYNTAIAFHGEDTDLAFRLMRVGVVKFSPRLPVLASGRRLRKEGALRTAWSYALNSLFVILYGRPLARTYTDVRE